MQLPTHPGPVIRFHRKRAGLSRRELGLLAGLSQSSIYEVEHGKETARLDTILKLLDALNIQMRFESPLMHAYREEAGK
ncbi:MAG: helix-turn-helix transcriptional regulator [Rhodothermales bacterium]|nr:helix-turn-helix transcriptional regulator [Rhodothermales bacterium]MBO6781488.1 helix-turn-helix transcriptional regulator [Rhodothermales bacterium]